MVKGKTKYGLRITDVLDMYGVSPVVYHSWVRKNDTNVNEHVRFTIKVKSGIDLLKFTDKLREIEEIEKVGILS